VPTPILATKLYIPPPRPKIVLRSCLIERLNEGLSVGRRLTLISAPAGFGKTTLVNDWIAASQRPTAWLSLDEGDNDLIRFLAYLVAALQTISANIGAGAMAVLESPHPSSTESLLTTLLNDITTLSVRFMLVLDDYHVIDSQPVEQALTFLLEHLPPQLHLVITTREDPPLPLARLRARDQLTELRAADLRFTLAEAAEFLNQVMGLNLSAEDIAALETRTEGWIAGLQLAAISMREHEDATGFIKSFTGSHHFVLDYLLEEVLHQQPESIQTFLLRTSILGRLCGPLCDAVLLEPSVSGQVTLEYLEHANLFIIPLDDERRWYRYHPLFAELLQQRLRQSTTASTGDERDSTAQYHLRASLWFEDHGLELEAFQHATAANDVERAMRLAEGRGIPLHYRGVVGPVLHWLESLPAKELDARPSLWVMYASLLMLSGQRAGIEQKLQAAEAALTAAALPGAAPDDRTHDLFGQIASMRALLAVPPRQIETIMVQSRRALELLYPDNLPVRAATTWAQGYAYYLQGDRAAASRAYTEVISISQASGNTMFILAATTNLGNLQEEDNQLYLAAQTYQRVLQLFGDQPHPFGCEADLGLARIYYEWNDLAAAEQHGQQSLQLARQVENTGTVAACEVFLARLKLTRGDVASATAILAEADQFVRQNNFVGLAHEVAAAQVLAWLRQGNLVAAAHLAQAHDLPISQARVRLAQGDTSAALAALEPWRRQVEAKGWSDERLKVMVLQAVAHHTCGAKDQAVRVLGDALALAEPGGFVRLFVDEGAPMAQLLSEVAALGIMPDYVGKLLAVFEADAQTGLAGRPTSPGKSQDSPDLSRGQPLIEPLSRRELEVLQLIAQGLSNREISERLFLAVNTVKGHNRTIFDKLQAQNRTEAVARARELGLL
jgi:LuxR family transcriptional regulator, maltose regulon positive regulatory protein